MRTVVCHLQQAIGKNHHVAVQKAQIAIEPEFEWNTLVTSVAKSFDFAWQMRLPIASMPLNVSCWE